MEIGLFESSPDTDHLFVDWLLSGGGVGARIVGLTTVGTAGS